MQRGSRQATVAWLGMLWLVNVVLVVAVASAFSALFAARKLADIDLVSALKALD